MIKVFLKPDLITAQKVERVAFKHAVFPLLLTESTLPQTHIFMILLNQRLNRLGRDEVSLSLSFKKSQTTIGLSLWAHHGR